MPSMHNICNVLRECLDTQNIQHQTILLIYITIYITILLIYITIYVTILLWNQSVIIK